MGASERREDRNEPTAADRAELARIDESELRIRLLEAFYRYLDLDLAVHLVAVKGRTAVEYRLVLYPDGANELHVSKIQEIADEYRLDFKMDRDRGHDAGLLEGGWVVILYPRW